MTQCDQGECGADPVAVTSARAVTMTSRMSHGRRTLGGTMAGIGYDASPMASRQARLGPRHAQPAAAVPPPRTAGGPYPPRGAVPATPAGPYPPAPWPPRVSAGPGPQPRPSAHQNPAAGRGAGGPSGGEAVTEVLDLGAVEFPCRPVVKVGAHPFGTGAVDPVLIRRRRRLAAFAGGGVLAVAVVIGAVAVPLVPSGTAPGPAATSTTPAAVAPATAGSTPSAGHPPMTTTAVPGHPAGSK